MTQPVTAKVRKTRSEQFVDILLNTKNGIRWMPFANRSEVERLLRERGYELCEDVADWSDSPLKNLRFFAMRKENPT